MGIVVSFFCVSSARKKYTGETSQRHYAAVSSAKGGASVDGMVESRNHLRGNRDFSTGAVAVGLDSAFTTMPLTPPPPPPFSRGSGNVVPLIRL